MLTSSTLESKELEDMGNFMTLGRWGEGKCWILHFSLFWMKKQSSIHFTKGKQTGRTIISIAASLDAIESLMLLFYFFKILHF